MHFEIHDVQFIDMTQIKEIPDISSILLLFLLSFAALFYAICMVIFSVESYKKGLVGDQSPSTRSPLEFSSSLYSGAFGVICGTLAGALYLVDYYKNIYHRQGYSRIN